MSDMDALLIGEVAAETGLTVHALRFYERAGAIPTVARDESGRRRYTEVDLAWIEYATCLRALGMGIADIAAYVDAANRRGGHAEQMRMLQEHLVRMRAQRSQLDGYIRMAEAKLAVTERGS